jgi:lactate dehydrogenase-like 2-hydroxyacid dehydrogenase
MKQTALLINVDKGKIVDENELAEALKCKRLPVVKK